MAQKRKSWLQKLNKKHLWVIVPAVLLIVGVYLLITALAPLIPASSRVDLASQPAQPQDITENRLYIPKLNIDVLIAEGDNETALEKGAWHRKPENGSPEKGGNFVLSAHRFQMGWTPGETRHNSPFYHIDKLQPGDKIYVDYNQTRYTYEVTKKYNVDRYAVEIESPSAEAKMTLYSCDLAGEAAGREVIEARPIKTEVQVRTTEKVR
jgi:sortase A